MSRHTISVLVENNFGALSRIAGLFSARGYNISSLSVSETEDPTMSRMTIVSAGDDKIIEQITKQLNRLIDVVKVLDIAPEDMLEREMMLVTLQATAKNRHELISLCDVFDGKVLALSANELTVRISGESTLLDDFIKMVTPYGIKEMARSGPIALAKAKK